MVQRSTRAVVAGNHSLQAARELGLEEVSVTLLDIDDEQAKQIMLVDNRTNDLASYDDRLSPGCSQSSRPRRHGLLAPRT
ncbi:MAG: hypothetical protein AVDCRST_MAG17-11 [uncultured Solirubrobacterales bacterium]|uniref:Uncharacterized protein n=1 Tax=uncultured Solirubrobacterales bacterium TaxID=768556 RepID=A0A6J4RPH0_9ACTN|nr:MAG: hypothetical protein AVDCRST_MAG17-11 [uncultured Solirubrobacterales bacterium]